MSKKVKWILLCLVSVFCYSLAPVSVTHAEDTVDNCDNALEDWSEEKLRRYAEDNILYYDNQFDECENSSSENQDNCLPTYNPSENDSTPTEGGGYSKLEQAIKDYHQVAMQAQKDYGTPWEMVFAQMQVESSVGTAGIAVEGATNNWLGITGEGDAGSWISPKGRKWAKFSSVEKSIIAWAGPRVLRRGYYDSAFQYLSLTNYDLNSFIRKVISIYAPASDGNDVEGYVNKVIGLINGPIKAAREKYNLPSSEEWAHENNIDAPAMLGTSPNETPIETPVEECKTPENKEGGDEETPVIVGNYAFPLLGATKSNYLNPGGSAGQSVLSRLPCGSGNCHHDYNAVDLGLRKKLVDGSEYTAADFPDYGFSDMYYYSMGVKVVALTSGKIIQYKPYSRATQGFSNQCASVMFLADDGHKFWFGHMKYDNSYAAINKQYKAGDIIGEVGLPQCAISTQSHLHIHMYVNPEKSCDKNNPGNCSRQIVDIIDELYQALPE